MNEVNIKFWLLTFDYFKKDIKKSEDNLIVLLHWLLLQNDFQVLGPGNEVNFLYLLYIFRDGYFPKYKTLGIFVPIAAQS